MSDSAQRLALPKATHAQRRPMSWSTQVDAREFSGLEQRRFVFCLLEGFPAVTLASAIEPLRLANEIAGLESFKWLLVADGIEPVRCSNGIAHLVDSDLFPVGHRDIVVVCGGNRIKHRLTRRLIGWLRREALGGARIAGLGTGSIAMAMAGLLNERSAVVHPDHWDSFKEEFPDVNLCRLPFVVDGTRMSSAGGTASSDLTLKIISDEVGPMISDGVALALDRGALRNETGDSISSTGPRSGIRHPKIVSVIRRMEENMEEPIAASVLARKEGMSLRQLERLFRRHMNDTPKRFYMDMRLQKARNLLMQTQMTILDVAVACGFGSPSHFSKCYRHRFNTTPYRERELHSGSNPSGIIR